LHDTASQHIVKVSLEDIRLHILREPHTSCSHNNMLEMLVRNPLELFELVKRVFSMLGWVVICDSNQCNSAHMTTSHYFPRRCFLTLIQNQNYVQHKISSKGWISWIPRLMSFVPSVEGHRIKHLTGHLLSMPFLPHSPAGSPCLPCWMCSEGKTLMPAHHTHH
jgi:hypothetical protein